MINRSTGYSFLDAGAHGLIFLPVLLSLMGPSMDVETKTEVERIENLEAERAESPKFPLVGWLIEGFKKLPCMIQQFFFK